MSTPKLTTEIITAAIDGFEQQKLHIDTKIAELRALLAGGSPEAAVTPEAASRKRSKFSAATRRKMALAQKARWAKIRGESEPPAPKETPKPKRKLTAAAKAKLVANLKKARAAKTAKAKAAAKKAAPARKKTTAKKAPLKKAAVKTAQAAAQTATAQ